MEPNKQQKQNPKHPTKNSSYCLLRAWQRLNDNTKCIATEAVTVPLNPSCCEGVSNSSFYFYNNNKNTVKTNNSVFNSFLSKFQ